MSNGTAASLSVKHNTFFYVLSLFLCARQTKLRTALLSRSILFCTVKCYFRHYINAKTFEICLFFFASQLSSRLCVLHISYNVGQTMAIGLPLLSPLADRIDRFERGGKASSTTHLSLVKETLKGGGARREGMIK